MSITLKKIKRKSKKNDTGIGYFIFNTRLTNFVFRIVKFPFKASFNPDKTMLVEIFNGEKKEFLVLPFEITFNEFKKSCEENTGFYCFEHLTDNLFQKILHKERVFYSNLPF